MKPWINLGLNHYGGREKIQYALFKDNAVLHRCSKLLGNSLYEHFNCSRRKIKSQRQIGYRVCERSVPSTALSPRVSGAEMAKIEINADYRTLSKCPEGFHSWEGKWWNVVEAVLIWCARDGTFWFWPPDTHTESNLVQYWQRINRGGESCTWNNNLP
jgi:hypothetical protein